MSGTIENAANSELVVMLLERRQWSMMKVKGEDIVDVTSEQTAANG
jgi:hypothetical protein